RVPIAGSLGRRLEDAIADADAGIADVGARAAEKLRNRTFIAAAKRAAQLALQLELHAAIGTRSSPRVKDILTPLCQRPSPGNISQRNLFPPAGKEEGHRMRTLLLVILILLLLGALPAWPYSVNWGYGPSGLLGLLLIVVLVLALVRRV